MKKLIAIAMLVATLGTATVVAPAVSPDTSSPFSITANAAIPEKNMYIGQRSETVKWLQWTLTALGYDTKGCDGVYGANTKAAVYRYQVDNGIYPKDGIAGPITIRHINNKALSLQDKLCRAGYPVTKDSILGPNTRKQIKEFNYNHNINGDIATDATWKALDQSLSYVTPLVNGVVYRITPKCAQNSCVDESTCSNTAGGNVHLWQYYGNKNQLWVCEYIGNGYYRFRNLGSGLYLDKSGGGNQSSNVVQYTKNGTYAQNWKIKNCGNGWYNIVNQAEGQYLDVNCCKSSNGTQIQTYWNTNCDAQRFKFTKVNVNSLSNGASTAVSKISNQRQKMVDNAYREYNARVSGYSNKYNMWYYGYNNQDSWCSVFVSYIANQSGVSTSVIPKSARCDYMQEWFEARGRSYVYKSSLNIQPGDLVILGYNRYVINSKGARVLERPHIGIVVEVNNSTIKTIEGNTSGYALSCVNIKTYNRNTSYSTQGGTWGINYVLKPAY